ncbi:aromatic amino acid hydroxylase [Bacillus alkalisoli]|uniref:aromatic amino acid hydroxylase n=1 Tax=Bacillus alkalisoli TaxID=2011008 RepID=UPI001D0D245B|nr:aromatic amino acid hydroxylase [Bacillus alkalisoli]
MLTEMKARKIPKHLQKFVVDQQYDKYTPIDHAVWRYVMRQNHHFLKDTSHEAYVDGLKASGIKINSIPNVDEMNESLAPVGWGAVNIDGFIPGVVFFEFQAHGLLPIASDIRKLENIQYTPAPDIIHEAAGHAPILLDEKFSEYVKLFGSIGANAIATKEEHDLFEAIRQYSNLLENGTGTDEQIEKAKQNFEEKQMAVTELSEAEQISRLYWWTVEYGLIGTVDDPKIYGAGLLSSVSEGRNSITSNVEKWEFDLEKVTQTGFDITKPQPQLFVCNSFEQLIEAVKEFANTMAFKVGGTESLEKALKSNHTATIVYSSGLQVTGTLTNISKDASGEANYIQFSGPSALAFDKQQLVGHVKERHTEGFSSPIGKLVNHEKPLEDWTDMELSSQGIEVGVHTKLLFEEGVSIIGTVTSILRKNQKIILITFKDCLVTRQNLTQQFNEFDMAVGATITSVFAGAADSEAFFADLETVTQKEFVPRELTELEKLYGVVREIRQDNTNKNTIENKLSEVMTKLTLHHPNDWLLRVEVLELLKQKNILHEEQLVLLNELEKLKALDQELFELIERGLKIIPS